MAMANLDDSADEFDTDVLIVGAGPAGLAAAIELGMRGVRSVLIEQQERTGVAPRAKTTNVRTRTHMRRWGIADRLAERSEEHTSELQSLMRISYAVFCLKKQK